MSFVAHYQLAVPFVNLLHIWFWSLVLNSLNSFISYPIVYLWCMTLVFCVPSVFCCLSVLPTIEIKVYIIILALSQRVSKIQSTENRRFRPPSFS